MAKELLTTLDIALRLQLFTTKGDPHIRIVNEIINELEIPKVGRRDNYNLYTSDVLVKIREWFGYCFDELPTYINMQSVRYERQDTVDLNIS